ncbi:hypothetical protein WJ71_09485 [Burkholderia ubonensis]|nr:hypothetical protein WJ71_09485 [Burkholderia ubonensis]
MPSRIFNDFSSSWPLGKRAETSFQNPFQSQSPQTKVDAALATVLAISLGNGSAPYLGNRFVINDLICAALDARQEWKM